MLMLIMIMLISRPIVALEKELEEKQHELSNAKGLEDYVKERTHLRAIDVSSAWEGSGILRNPWRNNPQFKVGVIMAAWTPLRCIMDDRFM